MDRFQCNHHGRCTNWKNCRIFPGAVISAIPQDLKFEGEDSLTVIGDNTTIRECVTINRGTNASGKTSIGDNCLIMATAHIAHDCVLGDNSIVVNGVALGGHVIIGEHAIIGGLAAVHQFIHIGEHAMVSGGSLVRKDVPPLPKQEKNHFLCWNQFHWIKTKRFYYWKN